MVSSPRFLEEVAAPGLVSSYIVKLNTGAPDPSTAKMKNLPFIHEYVGESVCTCLQNHIHVNISTAFPC